MSPTMCQPQLLKAAISVFSGDDLGLDQSGKKLYRVRDHVQDSEGTVKAPLHLSALIRCEDVLTSWV